MTKPPDTSNPISPDMEIAIKAEKEAEAQLAVVRALKPLNREGRERVMQCVGLLLAAEDRVPGIFALLAKGARGDILEPKGDPNP